jgi:hypothetical protein
MSVPAVPEDVERILDELARVVRAGADAIGLYAAGSLGSGDYRPETSDLDLVAVVLRPITTQQQRLLAAQHRRLAAEHLTANRLHCAYVAADGLDDLATSHPTWAHGRFLRRPLYAVTRAELHTSAVVVFGPPAEELVPPVDSHDLATAARTELTTVWRPATRRPWLWWQDQWVDLGLTTLVRAEATVHDGTLLTKSAAIERLASFGVPDRLVGEIARRRQGAPVVVRPHWRARRALLARRLVATGIERILAASP